MDAADKKEEVIKLALVSLRGKWMSTTDVRKTEIEQSGKISDLYQAGVSSDITTISVT